MIERMGFHSVVERDVGFACMAIPSDSEQRSPSSFVGSTRCQVPLKRDFPSCMILCSLPQIAFVPSICFHLYPTAVSRVAQQVQIPQESLRFMEHVFKHDVFTDRVIAQQVRAVFQNLCSKRHVWSVANKLGTTDIGKRSWRSVDSRTIVEQQ